MSSFTSAQALDWIRRAAGLYAEKKDYLTGLDAAIGDADHGANMARGFGAAADKLPELQGQDIGAVFKAVAMTLISTVGGASGPLYGSFFLQAAGPAAGRQELSAAELGACLEAGVKAVMARGKAVPGDKTMVDALVPAVEAYRDAADSLSGALRQAVGAARIGAEATIPLQARKGRASYLGERSIGHLDPGAASSVYLLETLQQAAAS